MAYGRLDVFWPDGNYETYTLEENSISIGRSSGNTIMLDTDTISRYHISITENVNGVQLADLDSANGTFVDGVRIASNEPRDLFGGEEIQIGHLRIIFHAIDEQPTLPMEAVGEDTQKIEYETIDFNLEVVGSEIEIPPGSHTSVELTIFNTANEKRRFAVMVSGMPEEWIRVNRPQLDIPADDSSSVLINIKPVRASESKPGIYQLKLLVFPVTKPMDKIETDVPINIQPYSGFGIALSKYRVVTGELFRLHLHNQGSAPLPILLNGLDKSKKLSFGITTPQMVLAAGARQVIQGEIKPKRKRIFGATADYPFELHVRSRDDAGFLAVVPGVFTERPAFPGWVAYVVGLLSLLLVALIILAGILILNAPSNPAVINSFTANTTDVTQGDIVQLNWDVEHADDINLNIDGVRVETELSSNSTYSIDTSTYNESFVVVLEVTDDEETLSESISIMVSLPLTVDVFEVTPQTLIRNVVQNLSANWLVSGATSTRIEGLVAFTQTAIETSQGAEGSFDVPGSANDSFSLTLIASDDNGNNIQAVIDIEVIDPTCTTTAETTIFELPNNSTNVVSTVPTETALVVTARDNTGGWLRVQLAGGNIGWGIRSEFTCDAIFNPDSLLIDPSTTPQSE